MNGPETIVAEVGSFLLAGWLAWLARECIRRNWVKFSLSASIAGPDARWPKPSKAVTEAPPEPAAGPVPISEGRKAGAA